MLELSALKVRVDQMESLESNVGNFIQANDSQDTAYSQLLLMTQPQIASLEFARKNNTLALNALMEQYEALQKQHEVSSILLKQTTESIELAQKQLAEMQESSLPDTQKEELETAIRELVQVLEEKKQLGDRYIQIHDDLMRQLKAAIDEKTALGEKIAARLENRIKESIFTQTNFYRGIGETLPAAVSSLGSRLSAVFSPSMWQALWGQIKIGGLSRCAIFGFWLVLILSFQARLRGILQRIEDGCDSAEPVLSWFGDIPAAPVTAVSWDDAAVRGLQFFRTATPRHRTGTCSFPHLFDFVADAVGAGLP